MSTHVIGTLQHLKYILPSMTGGHQLTVLAYSLATPLSTGRSSSDMMWARLEHSSGKTNNTPKTLLNSRSKQTFSQNISHCHLVIGLGGIPLRRVL